MVSTNPFEKDTRQIGSFPKFRGENLEKMETSTQIIFNRFNRSKISQVATFRVCFIVVAARFQSTLGRTASLCWWYIYLKTQSSSPAMTHLIFSQSKQKQKHLYNLQLHYCHLIFHPLLASDVVLYSLFCSVATHSTRPRKTTKLCVGKAVT